MLGTGNDIGTGLGLKMGLGPGLGLGLGLEINWKMDYMAMCTCQLCVGDLQVQGYQCITQCYHWM